MQVYRNIRFDSDFGIWDFDISTSIVNASRELVLAGRFDLPNTPLHGLCCKMCIKAGSNGIKDVVFYVKSYGHADHQQQQPCSYSVCAWAHALFLRESTLILDNYEGEAFLGLTGTSTSICDVSTDGIYCRELELIEVDDLELIEN